MATMSITFGLDKDVSVVLPRDTAYAHVTLDTFTFVCRDTEGIDKAIAALQNARARLMAAKIAEAKLNGETR